MTNEGVNEEEELKIFETKIEPILTDIIEKSMIDTYISRSRIVISSQFIITYLLLIILKLFLFISLIISK